MGKKKKTDSDERKRPTAFSRAFFVSQKKALDTPELKALLNERSMKGVPGMRRFIIEEVCPFNAPRQGGADSYCTACGAARRWNSRSRDCLLPPHHTATNNRDHFRDDAV